jgi:hypothetical protein
MTNECVIAEIVAGASDDYLANRLVDIINGEVINEEIQSAFLAEAAARLGRNVYPSDEHLKSRAQSKGELANNLYPEADGYSISCAVPQKWMEDVTTRMAYEECQAIPNGLTSHFVTVYKDDWVFRHVMPITRTGVDILARTWK